MKIFKQRFLIVYIYIKRSKVAGWYGMMKGNLKIFLKPCFLFLKGKDPPNRKKPLNLNCKIKNG